MRCQWEKDDLKPKTYSVANDGSVDTRTIMIYMSLFLCRSRETCPVIDMRAGIHLTAL